MCINKEIKITKNIYNEFKSIKFLSELFHYFTGKITYIVFFGEYGEIIYANMQSEFEFGLVI